MVTINAIRSGGQSGADRGALDAARSAGVAVRGWCPPGGWAEDFPSSPGVRALYPELEETPTADVVQRTEWNVRDADATLIVCPCPIEDSPGTMATQEFAQTHGKPCLVSDGTDAGKVEAWLSSLPGTNGIELNVAGPRASESPSAYGTTRALVAQLLGRPIGR